jgi:hypothetical protein
LASKGICRPIRAFLGDRRGISTIEFTLVAMIFFMFILGIIDFSRAMWEWNMAAKATHAGVRLAVVTDMVAEDWQTYSGIADGYGPGAPITAAPGGLTDETTCTNTGCEGSVDPSKFDLVAFNTILAEVQSVFSRVQPQNLEIKYRFMRVASPEGPVVYAGFPGNPVGPDVDALVTVRLVNMDFLFISLGFIGLDTMSMPDFAATLTGEDHCDLGPC